MSLNPQTQYVVPAETVKVAKAIFPNGNLCITMADCISHTNFNSANLTQAALPLIWGKWGKM